jgi:hypothetical protein
MSSAGSIFDSLLLLGAGAVAIAIALPPLDVVPTVLTTAEATVAVDFPLRTGAFALRFSLATPLVELCVGLAIGFLVLSSGSLLLSVGWSRGEAVAEDLALPLCRSEWGGGLLRSPSPRMAGSRCFLSWP